MGSDCQVYYCVSGILKAPDGVVTPRYSCIARWGSEASLKLSSGIPTCIPVSGQVFLQRQVWEVKPRSSERARWGSSVARGGVATPPSVDSGVFYWYSYCCPGIPFHIVPGRGGDTQYFYSKRQGKER